LKAETPTKSGPTIIIYDVDKNLPKEEIIKQMILKNCEDPNSDKEMLKEKIKFRFNIKTKNATKANWVVELPPVLYNELIRRERVYIGFLSYRIKTFINITRCFKCHGYGHPARNCTADQLCEKCGEAGYLRAACSAKMVCVNCKRGKRKEINHSVKTLSAQST